MKKATCILAVLVVLALLGLQQQPDLRAENTALRQEIQTLRARVIQLERHLRALGADPNDMTPYVPPTAAFTLIVEDVRAYEAPEVEVEMVKQLRQEMRGALASADDARGEADRNAEEKNAHLARAREYERKAKDLESQIKRITADWEGHFWILGWDGKRDLMIRTGRSDDPLCRILSIGQCVEWSGEIVESALGHPAHADYAIVVAPRIRAVPHPSGLSGRPGNREPVWVTDTVETHLPRLPHR